MQTVSAINLQSVIYREVECYVAQCLNVDVSSFGSTEAEAGLWSAKVSASRLFPPNRLKCDQSP